MYGSPRNSLGRFDVTNDFEIVPMRHREARMYAAGATTLGGPFATVDSFLGLQYAGMRAVNAMVDEGMPELRRLSGLYSLGQRPKWARRVRRDTDARGPMADARHAARDRGPAHHAAVRGGGRYAAVRSPRVRRDHRPRLGHCLFIPPGVSLGADRPPAFAVTAAIAEAALIDVLAIEVDVPGLPRDLPLGLFAAHYTAVWSASSSSPSSRCAPCFRGGGFTAGGSGRAWLDPAARDSRYGVTVRALLYSLMYSARTVSGR